MISTARSAGGGNASMAASNSGCRATRAAPGTIGYRSPKFSTSSTTGSGPAVARIETSTPGVTAMFTTRPGPPNHVSVHPPLSQIRTGTDASITRSHPCRDRSESARRLGEGRLEGDLGHARQRSAHRATGLCGLRVLDESSLVEAGHPSNGDQVDLGDRRFVIDAPERDRRVGAHRVGRTPGLSKDRRAP